MEKSNPVIGLDNFVYAKLLTDAIGTTPPTYGPVKRIPGAVQATVNPNSTVDTDYGDNGAIFVTNNRGNTEMSLEFTNIDNDTLAELLGQEKKNAVIGEYLSQMIKDAADTAREMNLVPYYLYRQKNTVGNLENVGYAKSGKECLYNVLIMEEKMDIIAVGAGTSTKLTFPDENRIERVENVKNVEEYINRVDEMIARKEAGFQQKQ